MQQSTKSCRAKRKSLEPKETVLWSGEKNDRNRRIRMSERILNSDEMNGVVQWLDEGQKFNTKNEGQPESLRKKMERNEKHRMCQ
jgi:hypothetical protein